MALTTLYSSILASLRVTAGEDGLLSLVNPVTGVATPIYMNPIDAKHEEERLTLPTDAFLRAPSVAGLMAFHPLSENTILGESPVIQLLTNLVQSRLLEVFSVLFVALTRIAADKKNHSKLSPKEQKLLAALPDADEKTVTAYSKILEAGLESGSNSIMALYLRRSSKVVDPEGEVHNYFRAAHVVMRIFDAIDERERTVFGQKPRVKDFDGVRKLLLYIFPKGDEIDAYTSGTVDSVAPYFVALMKTYYKVGRRLMQLVELHKGSLPEAEELTINFDWIGEIDNLKRYIDLIPPQAGNEGVRASDPRSVEGVSGTGVYRVGVGAGSTAAAAEEDDDTPPWKDPPTSKPTETVYAPQGTTAAPTKASPGTRSFDDVLKSHHIPTQPVGYGPRGGVGYGHQPDNFGPAPVGYHGQPGYGPQGGYRAPPRARNAPGYQSPHQQPAWQQVHRGGQPGGHGGYGGGGL